MTPWAMVFGVIFVLTTWAVFLDIADIYADPPDEPPLILWTDLTAMCAAAAMTMVTSVMPI